MEILTGLGCILALWLCILGSAFIGEQLMPRGMPVDELGGGHSLMSFSAAMGLALLSTTLLILSHLQLLSSYTLTTLLVVVALAGGVRLRILIWSKSDETLRKCLRTAALPLLGVTLLALPFLMAPPLGRDALVYHLEVPSQYLAGGGLMDLPTNVYSYFPMGIEMLYLPAMSTFSAGAARLVHFGFLLLTILGVVEYSRLAQPVRTGVMVLPLLLLALATVPTLLLNATSAYIDTGWMFFAFVTIAGLDDYFRSNRRALLLPAGIAAAFLLAVKYTSVYLILVIALAILLLRLIWRIPLPFNRRWLIVTALALVVSAVPYYFRNLVTTGDPVFPFLTGTVPVHTPFWSADQQAAFWGFLDRYGPEWLSPWLYPFNYVVAGINWRLHDPHLFDGVLGPFLFLPLLAWRGGKTGALRRGLFPVLVTVGYALVWGVSIRQARFLLPILPAVALTAVFGAAWLQENTRRLWTWLLALFLGGVLLFNLLALIPETRRHPYWDLLAGSIDRTEFLEASLPVYRSLQFINMSLPVKASVWLLLTGNENLFLDRDYQSDYVVEDYRFHRWLIEADSPAELTRHFQEMRADFLLVRQSLVFDPRLYDDFPEKLTLVHRFFREHVSLLFAANDYGVYALPSPPERPSPFALPLPVMTVPALEPRD
ncbi:MAG: hypothetical protein JXQ27_03815 [Acidobacteria bacterium]|nr:hypothetical protein [Acidobacteriota bacterium]